MEETTEVITKSIKQEQALEAIDGKMKAGAFMSMGSGKTLVGIKSIQPLDRVIVAYPFKTIRKAWIDDMEKFNLHKEDQITFTTYLSLLKHNPNDFDYLICDECHCVDLVHAPFFMNFKGRILGLTGTPRKSHYPGRDQMFHYYFPETFKYGTDDAIDDEIINDYKIIIHPVNLDKTDNIEVNHNGKSWKTSEVKTYDYWTNRISNANTPQQKQIFSLQRMKAMQGFKSKEVYCLNLLRRIEDKCIVFCNTTEQADRMCPDTYHSKNPDSVINIEKLSNGLINRLAAVNQLDMGINIKGLKCSIILHSFANNRRANQKLGRNLRLSPDELATVHILMFKDSIDEVWVSNALSNLNKTKITYL